MSWTTGLSYAPDRDSRAADLPDSVFTAIREQLGLELAAQKGQVEFVIIERLERLIPNRLFQEFRVATRHAAWGALEHSVHREFRILSRWVLLRVDR